MGILIVERHVNNPQTHIRESYFKAVTFSSFDATFCVFNLNICQFLCSLKIGALGNRLSRHGPDKSNNFRIFNNY